MANITLTFANDINVSLQKKGVSDTGQDIVYYGLDHVWILTHRQIV
jgi:hypothetical protein